MHTPSLAEWEGHRTDQRVLCKQCTSQFSTFKALQSLTSPQGRYIDFVRFLESGSALTCPLCVLIRETIYPSEPYKGRFPFLDGRRADLRLKVECEKELGLPPFSFPFSNHIPQRTYPSNVTSIRHVVLVPTSGEDLGELKYFLAIYRPLGICDIIPALQGILDSDFLRCLDAPATYPLHCYPQGHDMLCDLYMEKAKRKLEECKSKHDRCKDGNLTPLLPTRVIDVGMDNRHPRLYTSRAGERSDYAVLSYCLGGPRAMATTENVAAMTEGLLPASQSVNDAIKVDAICIIQDDAIDKARELKAMEQIYATATLTICASNSQSAAAGFVSTQPPKGCELPLRLPDGSFTSVMGLDFPRENTFKETLGFWLRELKWQCPSSDPEYTTSLKRGAQGNAAEVSNFPGDSGYSHNSDDVDDSDNGKFIDSDASEAWEDCDDFEESDDSDDSDAPRTSVGDPGLECLTPHAFENEDRDFFSPHSAAEIFHAPRTNDLWHDIIREYSCREHTVPQDRVHGIGGVIRALEIAWLDVFIAGLWRSQLVQCLFWKINERREGRKKLHWKRPDLYVAPSWSWLSAPDAVCYRLIDYVAGPNFFCLTAQVLEYPVDLVDENLRLGEIREGRVVLRTMVLPAPGNGPGVAPGAYFEADETEGEEPDIIYEDVDELDSDSGADTDDTDTWGRTDLVFAKLGYSNHWHTVLAHGKGPKNPSGEERYVIGLILQPVEKGNFKRVGTFQPDGVHKDSLSWGEAEERTVTII